MFGSAALRSQQGSPVPTRPVTHAHNLRFRLSARLKCISGKLIRQHRSRAQCLFSSSAGSLSGTDSFHLQVLDTDAASSRLARPRGRQSRQRQQPPFPAEPIKKMAANVSEQNDL